MKVKVSDSAYNGFKDPQLRDPICEGSVVQIGEFTAFSNPPMSYARANLSIALSKSGGLSWDYRLDLIDGEGSTLHSATCFRMQITDEYQYTDYSSLVNGELLVRDPGAQWPVAGLLWGSCLHPIPMRVWCLWPTSWNIYFSRVQLDPQTFVQT